MKDNTLKHIDGKKIRRQYFNIPLIILYSLMLAIPYAIFTISLCIGKFDSSAWQSTLLTSIWVCFCFSLPFLILRTLNKHFFGRIICVLTEDGIHYPKGMIRWETIEKIEYAIDTKPRYKNDLPKAFRTIIYTKGGKHIVLANTPLCILSGIKKFRKDQDAKISGATSLLPIVLLIAFIILVCPFYVVLLRNAPGASDAHLIVMSVIWAVFSIVSTYIFTEYAIQYRFWRVILPKKWLSYIILGFNYSSFFIALLVLFYFPNWIVVSLLGIYLGIVQPPIPSKHSSNNNILTYKKLYNIYITKADFWENLLAKNRDNKGAHHD